MEKSINNRMEAWDVFSGIPEVRTSHIISRHGFLFGNILGTILNYQRDPCVINGPC